MNIDRNGIREQIVNFVEKYINENDFVIGVLRYGAHIPHIYQNACNKLNKRPKQVNIVLSHMLGFFPENFYKEKNFIILDDTVYEGVEMKRIISTLVNEHKVPVERVKTATLIAHEHSKYLPDYPQPSEKFPDHQYIAWKEELASLVRRDIRPTERDHPLFYFDGCNLDLGTFIALLSDYGHLHPVGGDWDAPVFRASLTIDSSILSDLHDLIGIELDEVSKIRFYWQQTETGCRITAAPIVFIRLDTDRFLDKSDQDLARRCGLNDDFFKNLYKESPENSRGHMLFFFVGRSLAALMLRHFIAQIAPRMVQLGCSLQSVRPEVVDAAVNYIFPDAYLEFYNTIFNNLKMIIGMSYETDNLPFIEEWRKIEAPKERIDIDPLIPDAYEILDFITKDSDSARWNGARWVPAKRDYKGVTHQDLVKEFKDAAFISAALDELLDSGLIRAMDRILNSENGVYEREFFPGGEYNAVQVSRIADVLRCDKLTIDPKLTEEEALELWGA
jgi:hypothetical protein